MKKETTETIKITQTTHHFYCDGCSTHLGSSTECDDGWYQEFGEFELKTYTPRGWYRLNKCFCDDCRDRFLEKFYDSLEAAGFELN